jgi:hypothetical protein
MRWLQIWLQAAGGRPRPAGTGAWSSQARQSQTGSSQCLPRRANAADARAACRPRNEHHHQPPAWATAGHGGSSRIMRSRASEIPAASSHRAHVRACATHRMRAGAGGPCVRGMMVARSMLSLVALRAAACAAAAYPLSCPASPAARSIHPRPPPQLFHIGSIAPRRDKLCGGHHPTATCHCHCLFRSLLPPKSFGIAPPNLTPTRPITTRSFCFTIGIHTVKTLESVAQRTTTTRRHSWPIRCISLLAA